MLECLKMNLEILNMEVVRAYHISALLFILTLGGLSNQETSEKLYGINYTCCSHCYFSIPRYQVIMGFDYFNTSWRFYWINTIKKSSDDRNARVSCNITWFSWNGSSISWSGNFINPTQDYMVLKDYTL